MAIAGDTLSGLPAAGSNIGGAMKGVAPGAGAMILIPGIASSVARVPGYVAKGIEKRAGRKSKRTKKRIKKATHKPRTKSLHKAPRYNTPLIPKLTTPKMGPY